MRWLALLAPLALGLPTDAPAQFAVKPGGSVKLRSFYAVDLDCTSAGPFTISMIHDPQHGHLRTAQETTYPRFTPPNPRTKCNTTPEPATAIFYEPDKGFVGTDTVSFDAIGPRGRPLRVAVFIAVK